jgi:glutamyl-tRNA reductase
MSVLVVGLNYRAVPLEILERFSIPSAELPKALYAIKSYPAVREAVILSTCNRIEVYAVVTGYHAGIAAAKQFLSEFHHVAPNDFGDRLTSLFETEAVTHVFNVASGIDSMVVGEPQILSQVRRAFRSADEEGAVGSTLSAPFRHAISVGRRARAETDIARTSSSFAAATVSVAAEAFGDVGGRTVLVVGAGKMSDVAAQRLARAGARILIANRTSARADELAARVGGRAVVMANLHEALARADLVLSSTGSPDPVITRDAVERAMAGRSNRPLWLIDLAVPRDVEPSVASLAGVLVRDMDDLRDAVAPSADQLAEVDRVRTIVADEVPRFTAWQRAHVLAPLVAALKGRAEHVRETELAKAMRALGPLPERERVAVEAMTRAIVAKLLHDPVSVVKEKAGTPEGDLLARAVRTLYGLPDEEG